MANLEISVLIPVRNGELFLEECLNSIVHQTFCDFEVIIVNDYSTDGTARILSNFEKKDPRFSWYENSNRGIIGALQLALSKSSGRCITRMDADDIMETDKLETMHRQLCAFGEGYVALGLVKYFSEKGVGNGFKKYENWLNNLSKNGSNFDDSYKECVIPSPCWMLHASDLTKIGGFDLNRYPEDYDLAFRMKKAGIKVIPAQKVLHFWRDYASRTSRIDENYADNSFLRLKLDYFLELDRDEKKELVLWGAGKKGKRLAQMLIGQKLEFIWVTNNEKKVGKAIYNQWIVHQKVLGELKGCQILVSIADRNFEQVEEERLKNAVHVFYHFA